LINYVSHGSVATQLKCGGIFNNYVIANCPQYMPVKNVENPLIFGEVIKNDNEMFLEHSVDFSAFYITCLLNMRKSHHCKEQL